MPRRDIGSNRLPRKETIMTKLYSLHPAPFQIPKSRYHGYLVPIPIIIVPLHEDTHTALLLRQHLSHLSNVPAKRSKNPVTQLSTSATSSNPPHTHHIDGKSSGKPQAAEQANGPVLGARPIPRLSGVQSQGWPALRVTIPERSCPDKAARGVCAAII
jgi:hypothetical protein